MKNILRLFSLFLLVIPLTACKSYLLSQALTRPGDMLYWDDFSDRSGGWQQVSDATGSMGYANDAYQIRVNKTGYELGSLSGHLYRDVRVEVDAARLAGPVQNLFGLVCRAQGNQDYYFFVISSDGYYAVGKFKHGSAALLGQKMMAYNQAIVPGDGPNHLRFDCVGDTLTGSVNGQTVALVKDSDFSDGDAGLLAGAFDAAGVQVSFDNFAVIQP